MTDSGENAGGKPSASETAVPAGMMEMMTKMMERGSCRCAEMMPLREAMCAGTDQDEDVAQPPAAAATGSGEGTDP